VKRQPTDPFKGAGDFVPKPKRSHKAKAAKPSADGSAVKPLRTSLMNIRSTAEGALARLHLIDMDAAADDFEWIIKLADEGLKQTAQR
jgi:hypothetical protein